MLVGIFIMIGIYKITSPSKKIYIGQSTNIEKRFFDYKKLRNCIGQKKLYNSFIKHSVELHKFEIVSICLEQDLNDIERYYQDLFSCITDAGLNLKLTKSIDRSGEFSNEHKNNISKSKKGIVFSNEHKNKLSLSAKNRIRVKRPHSLETRKKMSESKKGIVFSDEHKSKLSISAKNRIRVKGKKYKTKYDKIARFDSAETQN